MTLVRKAETRNYINLLITYLKPQWPRVIGLGGLLLSSIALQLISPQLVRTFIDRALAGVPLSLLTNVALLFIGVTLLQQVVGVGSTFFSERVGWTATNRLRADLAQHCLGLDLGFHKKHTPGELIERIDGDISTLANFFTEFTIQIVGNGLLLVGILIALSLEDWRAGIILLPFLVIGFFILRRIQTASIPRWVEERQASAALYGFLEERLAATEDLRTAGAEGYVMNGLFRLMAERLHKELSAEKISVLFWITGRFLLTGFLAAGLIIGVYLFRRDLATIGTVYLIVYYVERLVDPLEQFTRQLQDFQRAAASIGRVQDLLETESVLPAQAETAVGSGAAQVTFNHVSFAYEPTEPILHDLSFEVEAGTTLAVLGRTGSGKSTLARLLLRLYDPTSGSICLNGVDLRNTDLSALRQHVGLVTQDVQLFSTTVRDNLTFFDRRISDVQLKAALAELGLTDWLDRLPHGLDTRLSAGSGGLSAGEAQLLAFTRVLLKDPGLVILDEASARLDPATEQTIEQAIVRLLQNRTGIIIAHRLSTIRRADTILILEDGRIAEFGPRRQLEADLSSRYAALLRVDETAVAV